MLKYSLCALFYWWTVWIVSASVLTLLMPPLVALYIVTVWLLGTAIVIKAYGRGLSFAYSALVGFAVCVSLYVRMALRIPQEVPPFLLHFINSVLLGTTGGTVVWCAALGAEAAFKRFVCRRVG